MIAIILKFVLVILSAICKAVADTVCFHKGGKLKGDFWDMTKQGKFLPFTKYPLDGWHLANSGFIIFLVAACVLNLNVGFLTAAIGFVLLGIVFNLVFNLFFNKILR